MKGIKSNFTAHIKTIYALTMCLTLFATGCMGISISPSTDTSSANSESTTTLMVTPDGATLINGFFALAVSEGAVASNTEISITKIIADEGLSWIFGPSGFQFEGDVWAYLVITEDEFRTLFGEYEDLDGNPVDQLANGVPLLAPSLESDDGSFEILDYTVSLLEDGMSHDDPVAQDLIEDAPAGTKIVIKAKIQHFSIYRIRIFRHKPKSPDGQSSEFISVDNVLTGPFEKEVNSTFDYDYTVSLSKKTVKKKTKKTEEKTDSKDSDAAKKDEPKTVDIVTHEFYSKPSFTLKKFNYKVTGEGSLVSNSENVVNDVDFLISSSDEPKVKCGSKVGTLTLAAKATVTVRYGLVGAISLTNKTVTIETKASTDCIEAEEDEYDDYYCDPESDDCVDPGEESIGLNPFADFNGQSFVYVGGCPIMETFTLATSETGTALTCDDVNVALGLDGTDSSADIYGQSYDVQAAVGSQENEVVLTFTDDSGSCEGSFMVL